MSGSTTSTGHRFSLLPEGAGRWKRAGRFREAGSRERNGFARNRSTVVEKAFGSFWILAMSLGIGTPAAGQVAPVAPVDTAQAHIVRIGDTLWDLSAFYLTDPYLWPEIFSLNRATILDPNLIFPNQRLLIPGRVGVAAVALGQQAPPPPPRVFRPTVFAPIEPVGGAASRTFRLTPQDEVAFIPAGVMLSAGMLVTEDEVSPLGRVVEVISPTVVPRGSQPQIQPYDRINAVLQGPGVDVGDRVHLIRPGRLLEPHGRIYLPTGSAVVLAVEAGVATLEVDRFYDQVALDDLLVETPELSMEAGVMPVPADGLSGTLLAFEEDQPIISTEEFAFLDLGSSAGVEEGDEFVAYIPARVMEWGTSPEVPVARLQVVRAHRVTSTVRVLSLEHPALEAGLPVRLVARVP
jgi:hypothetical protein